VLVASERAREIRRQNKDSEKREHVHSIVTALEEIQAGGIDPRKYLNKVK
jgi:DNA-directed RNA polymerase subunit K/omega